MMSFNGFFYKYNSRNKTTSNIKIQQVLSSIGLDNVGIHLQDGPFSSDIRIVNLHPLKGTHWVCYMNIICFDSYGCAPPQKLSKFIIKRYGLCLYSEYKIRGLTNQRDFYCASYCLYIIYLTNVMGIEFKSVVLNLYYQRNS